MMDGWPIWLQAALWGLVGGSALVLGAAIAWLVVLPTRLTASVMAFGCGVLVSAVAYDLVQEGFEQAGIAPVVIGALVGSTVYTGANLIITWRGGRHRKRSTEVQADVNAGGAMAIAVGSLLDGLPESVVLGVGLLEGGGVSVAMLAAIFLSNLPEGLSSAVGMKKAGRSARYVFGLWTGIALASGLAALVGAALLGGAPPAALAMVNAVAAGALLTMIAETMIPEAVQGEPGFTGFLVMLGFLVSFALSHRG